MAPRLQLKVLLRDVHRAVWRRVRVADSLSIAGLHQVIQLLMGWDEDHLHRFRIHGQDYGVAQRGGPDFGDAAAAVPLSWFGFRPTERFWYEYDFVAGWQELGATHLCVNTMGMGLKSPSEHAAVLRDVLPILER